MKPKLSKRIHYKAFPQLSRQQKWRRHNELKIRQRRHILSDVTAVNNVLFQYSCSQEAVAGNTDRPTSSSLSDNLAEETVFNFEGSADENLCAALISEQNVN